MHVATRRELSSSARSCARTHPCAEDGDGQISSRECARLMSLFFVLDESNDIRRARLLHRCRRYINYLAALCVTGSQLIPKLIPFETDVLDLSQISQFAWMNYL